MPAATGPPSTNAPGAVAAPLLASTTWMPLSAVNAPGPPTLVTRMLVVPAPVARASPVITSLSDGEPSPGKEGVEEKLTALAG